MSRPASIRTWLATADAGPARIARAALRSANRWRARFRSGSVHAEMDRIVAEATDNSVGSGLAASLDARAPLWRARQRDELLGEPRDGVTRREHGPLR